MTPYASASFSGHREPTNYMLPFILHNYLQPLQTFVFSYGPLHLHSSHTPIQHDDDTQKAPGDGLSSASTLDSFLDAPADYLARGTSGDGCTLLGKTFSKPTEKDLPRDLPESSVTWKQEASTSQSVSVIPKNIPKSDRKKRMSKKERAAMKSGNDVNVVMQQSPKIISGKEMLPTHQL